MGWPVAADVEARTKIALTAGVTSYGLSVTALLASVKAHCESYCNREFDEAEVTEVHDGGTVIVVRRPPIVAVKPNGLIVWGRVLAPDEFFVYPHFVRLIPARLAGLSQREPQQDWPQAIRITYIGGYSDASGDGHIPIPTELKEIVLEFASRWLLKIDEQYRIQRNVASVTVGSLSATFDRKDTAFEDLYRRLDRFRLVTV